MLVKVCDICKQEIKDSGVARDLINYRRNPQETIQWDVHYICLVEKLQPVLGAGRLVKSVDSNKKPKYTLS